MRYILIICIALITIGGDCKKSIVTKYCGIKVVNNSPKTIVALLGYRYPDVSVPVDSFLAGIPKGDYTILDTRGRCEDVFDNLPRDTISIFLFDVDTIKRYTWNDIRGGNKVLKRYDLSLQHLKDNNFLVTYP